MIIGNKEFTRGTHILGILNVTPDSFSDGGTHNTPDSALKHAEAMINDGADVIDIGGESTRPGHTRISDAEEISRVVPVIKAVKSHFDIPVSIDTYKPAVCAAALDAGADMVNDIWGFADPEMARLTKEYGVSCCLMHNRAKAEYDCFFEDLQNDLKKSIETAKAAGISDDRIMLDPGVGFAKSYEQNLEAIRRIGELNKLGFPVLLGTSRKSVIGITLGTEVNDRVEGTLATTAYAVMNNSLFVRVHDVAQNRKFITMLEAIRRSGE